MYPLAITKHTVTDYVGFEGEHSMQLCNDKPTVILGINGAGKTSLLNSIYATVIPTIKLIQSNPSIKSLITTSNVNTKTIASIGSSILTLNFNPIEKYNIIYKNSISSGPNYENKTINQLGLNFKSLYENANTLLPIIRYFQSTKHLDNNQSIITQRNYNQLTSRAEGYKNHTQDGLSIKEVTGFIIDQVNIENQAKIDHKDFNYSTPIGKYIRETINTFTSILYGDKVSIKVNSSKYSNGQSLIIKKQNEELEFVQLSSGEKYIYGMVLELIYRNVTLNPSFDDLNNTPGIVLIDEIDSHLHPRWQLTILKALQNCFPKVQFIVTTHSPLIASSVRKEQIIALSNFEIIPAEALPNIYSGTANELLEKILFADFQINDFQEEKKVIQRLLDEFQYDEAEQKLLELKEKVNAEPAWINDYELQIAFAKT